MPGAEQVLLKLAWSSSWGTTKGPAVLRAATSGCSGACGLQATCPDWSYSDDDINGCCLLSSGVQDLRSAFAEAFTMHVRARCCQVESLAFTEVDTVCRSDKYEV